MLQSSRYRLLVIRDSQGIYENVGVEKSLVSMHLYLSTNNQKHSRQPVFIAIIFCFLDVG